MKSERNDRSTRQVFKVTLYALLGAALGLFTTIACFELTWQQQIPILEPIHILIVAGVSLIFATLAAIDVGKFLCALIESLSQLFLNSGA